MNILRLLTDLHGNASRCPVESPVKHPVECPRLSLTDLPYNILYLIFLELETTSDVASFALISQETHHVFKKAYPLWMKVRCPLGTKWTSDLLQLEQMWNQEAWKVLPRSTTREMPGPRCIWTRELVGYLQGRYFSKAVSSADAHFCVGAINAMHPHYLVPGAPNDFSVTPSFSEWLEDNAWTMADRVHWLKPSELTCAHTVMAEERVRHGSKKDRNPIQLIFGRFKTARWQAQAGMRFFLTDYWVLVIVCFTRRPAATVKLVGSSS